METFESKCSFDGEADFIEMTIGTLEALLKLSPPGTGLLRSITEGVCFGVSGRSSSSGTTGDLAAAVLQVVTLKRDAGCAQGSSGVDSPAGSIGLRSDLSPIIVFSVIAE